MLQDHQIRKVLLDLMEEIKKELNNPDPEHIFTVYFSGKANEWIKKLEFLAEELDR